MATLLDTILKQGKTYGTYVPPTKVTQAYNPSNSLANTIAKAVTTAKNAPASSSSGGGGATPAKSNLDPHINPATGVWDDNYYAQQQAANGGGSAPVDQALQLAKDTITAANQANSQYQAGVSAYDKANPFSQSDIMAKEAKNAASLVNPYYDQLLTNYIQGVNYQRGNTLQDEMRTISKLQADSDAYTGQAKKLLDTTLTQVGQQYSDAGSYDSGARSRAQGIQEANTGYDIAQNQRQTAYDIGSTQIQANRELNQTLPLQELETEQEAARNRATDIASTQNMFYNYDVKQNDYNRAKAGVAAVQPYTADGQTLQVGGALPGMTSYDTSQQLQNMLPGIQTSSFGGHALYDTSTPTT